MGKLPSKATLMELEGSSRASGAYKEKHIARSWEMYAEIFLLKLSYLLAAEVVSQICVN